jgi:UDP-glucuronate decarboxylase
MIRNEPLIILNDGSQTQRFCFVDIIIRGLMSAMDTPQSFTGKVNRGNPQTLIIRQLIWAIIRLTRPVSLPLLVKEEERWPL